MSMAWFEKAKAEAPNALYMAVSWTHADGRIVNVSFTDLTRASFAEAGLIGEQFFPGLLLMLVPGKPEGLTIRSEAALNRMKDLCRLDVYDTKFFLGNLFLYPASFMIVGIWYPRRVPNLLFR